MLCSNTTRHNPTLQHASHGINAAQQSFQACAWSRYARNSVLKRFWKRFGTVNTVLQKLIKFAWNKHNNQVGDALVEGNLQKWKAALIYGNLKELKIQQQPENSSTREEPVAHKSKIPISQAFSSVFAESAQRSTTCVEQQG